MRRAAWLWRMRCRKTGAKALDWSTGLHQGELSVGRCLSTLVDALPLSLRRDYGAVNLVLGPVVCRSDGAKEERSNVVAETREEEGEKANNI